jgi:hypothetical protein
MINLERARHELEALEAFYEQTYNYYKKKKELCFNILQFINKIESHAPWQKWDIYIDSIDIKRNTLTFRIDGLYSIDLITQLLYVFDKYFLYPIIILPGGVPGYEIRHDIDNKLPIGEFLPNGTEEIKI